jgi:hypothetical protein
VVATRGSGARGRAQAEVLGAEALGTAGLGAAAALGAELRRCSRRRRMAGLGAAGPNATDAGRWPQADGEGEHAKKREHMGSMDFFEPAHSESLRNILFFGTAPLLYSTTKPA